MLFPFRQFDPYKKRRRRIQRSAARNEMNSWPACVEHNRTHEQHHNRLLYMYTLRLYRAASMPQKKWTMLICATRAWRLSSKVHKDRDIKILFRCATVHGFSCTSRITHAASGFFKRTPPSSIFQRCKSRKKLKMTSFKVNLVYCSATFSFRPPQRIERFTRVCIDRYNKRK